MKHHILATLVGFSLVVTSCSQEAAEEEPAEQEIVLSVATMAPGILSDGPDALLSPEAFTAQCDADVGKATAMLATMKAATGPATVDRVLGPIDELDMFVSRPYSWAYLMSFVHPSTIMRGTASQCVQKFIPIFSDIGLAREIYDRLIAVDVSDADSVLQHYHADQVRNYKQSGVDKDDETRAKIKALEEKLSDYGQTYERNIREDVRYVEVMSVEELDGLPQDYIDNHPPDENGVIRISTNYPDLFPVMSYAHNDDLRRKLRLAYGNRAYPENEDVLRNLLQSRHDLAGLLGHETHADAAMFNMMVNTPQKSGAFIDEIAALVRPSAMREKARLLERYQQIDPEATKVMPWQRSYIEELIRREEYEIDSREVRQYFQYDNVQSGIFTLIEDLFELEFRPWETSVWDESVEAFEVLEGGAVIGRFYLDMHPRDGKYKHAAHMRLRTGVVGKQIPLSALMTNFPGGDGTLGLMDHAEVATFLHEFGHLIHNMLSGTREWSGVSGMSMESDFVEAPSQMLEEWMWDYETIKAFGVDEAGKVLPVELFEKMKAARNFGLATGTAGQTFLASMSLNFHNRSPADIDFNALQEELYSKYSVYDYEEGTHLFANFGHLRNMSSNYYAYQWSLAIAYDMLTRFEDGGLRNKDIARDYRIKVLGAAGSKPAAEFVEDFLDRPISMKSYSDWLAEAVSE